MRMIVIGLLLLGSAVLYGAYKFSRAGYESAPYTVVSEQGDFEIRDYPEIVVASTPMSGADLEDDESFMRLFGYISGENKESEKIAMTTPVFSSQDEGERRMSFVVPREVAREGAPVATHSAVEIRTIQAGRFAVYRFSGSREPKRFEEAEEKLMGFVRSQGLTPIGDVLLAGYDPPFTPSFLRRNEALVRVEAR